MSGRELLVPADAAGERLDRWLADSGAFGSRSQAGRAISEGRLRVDGEPPPKPGLKLRGGERIDWDAAEEPPERPEPEPIPLSIVYEDARIIVLDKQAGLVVHPAEGHWTGTLVHGLLHRFPTLSALGGSDRPGIVHRLDKDTTGLMVVARDDEAHRLLAKQFETRRASRRYLTVVHGLRLDDEGTLETRYGRHAKDRKRMTGRMPRGVGKLARTHWRVLARGEALSLVLLKLDTGRTHQIRVHMAEKGYPVVGDMLYGRPLPKGGGGRLAVELAAGRRMARQALHAAALELDHPDDGRRVAWTAPLPDDMAALVSKVFGDAGLEEAHAAAARPF